MVDGIPYSNRDSTLSLLPGAALGRWIAGHQDLVRGRLLDCGCGNQPFREWYGPLVDDVVALDATAIEGISVIGFADELPFAAKSFDTVLLTEVLEHVGDLEGAVSELHRVLRPGGHALVTIPYLYPTHEAPYDFRRLTHFGFRAVLERHGLEVLSLDAKGGGLLMMAHLMVLAVVAALDGVSTKLMLSRSLTDFRALRWLLGAPQELVGRRLRTSPGVTGSASSTSLGYMAVVRRPL